MPKRTFLCSSYRHKRRLIQYETNNSHSPLVDQDKSEDLNNVENVHEYSPLLECNITELPAQKVLENDDILRFGRDYNFIEVEQINENPKDKVYENEDIPVFQTNEEEFILSLRQWVNHFKISQSATSSLLQILTTVPNLKYLPNDARTLMKTPASFNKNILKLCGGQFIHFSLNETIKNSVQRHYKVIPKTIKINVNIDGLPLFNSSKSQFWPILGCIVDNFPTQPFVISLFHGTRKPHTANDFLKKFVDDFQSILLNPICIDGKGLSVSLNAVICDAPAKAFIAGIKSHTAFYGCSKCVIRGKYIDNRVTYPNVDEELRTDESFRDKLHPNHHNWTSYLENLNIGMVSQIPNDPMHLVYLGITKRLCQFWVSGKAAVRLNKKNLEKISDHLNLIKRYVPDEFSRKPRSLSDIEHWKASELRQLLLYTGIVVMKSTLSTDQYDHFLVLSIAIRILSCEESHLKFNDNADSLLKWFVTNYSVLYGEQNMVYNVHNLIHLANDVKKFGVIENFSAFKFEHFLGSMKKKIRISGKPLQQFCNRLKEEDSLFTNKVVKQKYPMVHYKGDSITKVTFDCFSLDLSEKNRCFEHIDGNIYEICGIDKYENNVFISAKKYSNVQPLFLYPFDSRIFSMVIVSSTDDIISRFPISIIKRKCFKIVLSPEENTYAVIPLIHTSVIL